MNHYLKSQRSQCYCVACSYDSQHSLQIETFVLGRREIRSLWKMRGTGKATYLGRRKLGKFSRLPPSSAEGRKESLGWRL